MISGPYQPVLTDKKEALFFILHYYEAYPILQNLGMYFGISDAAASQYIELLKPCLKAALQQKNGLAKRLFTGQDSFEKTFTGVQDLFIDVTEIPIERAKNQDVQRSQYRGKKTAYAKMAAHLRPISAYFICQQPLRWPYP